MLGLIALGPTLVMRSVYPSGADWATKDSAIMPLAPARFSITTGWRQVSLMCCPISRATTSDAPPGG